MTKKILKVNEDELQKHEKDHLHAELVSQLYALAPAGTIATLLNSSLLIFILWDDISRSVLMSWYSSLLSFTLARYVLFFKYKRAFVSPAESYRWGTLFVIGMAVVGMLWGSAGVFLFIEDSILLQILVIFILGGMVAGATASSSALKQSFLAFTLPASLPVIFRILVVGDRVHLAMAGMSLLFVVLMYFIAQRMHNVTVSSLKLRFDNQGLVTYLSEANDEAVTLNKKLRSEIAERKKTEYELKRHRDHLEDIVAIRTSDISDANARLQWEINERKKAEEALKKSEEYFRMLIENASDIITILDGDGIIQYQSPSIQKILGYGDEELNGRDVFDLIHSGDHQKAREALHSAVQKPGEVASSEVRFRHKDGSWRVLSAVGKAVINELVPVFVINSRDITDQKDMEEELISSRKLESLGILAGGIAHDFNNLLTGVMGNIDLSRRYLDPGNKAYAYMDEAEKAVQRASGLTKQLLTFSKGGSPIKKAASVENIIRDSADFALRGSNVTCHYHIADDLRDVEADAGQISQVVHNLVMNADQAMPKGGVITITAENASHNDTIAVKEEQKNYVKITVADEGGGIGEQNFQKIFDPYFSTKPEGSGLGLSVAYSIIKNHDGYIKADSAVNEGAVFTVYLPASEKRRDQQERDEEQFIRGRGKILVMDDEEVVRDIAGAILSSLGYRTGIAHDGKEAIEAYKNALDADAPFDAVILDLTIPGGMGGKDAIRELRKLDPHIRAIVSSGYSEDPVMANFKDYGFAGIITKPYSGAELSRIVNDVLTDNR